MPLGLATFAGLALSNADDISAENGGSPSHSTVVAESADLLILPEFGPEDQPLPLAVWLHGYGASSNLVQRPFFQRLANRRGLAILGVSAPMRHFEMKSGEAVPSGYEWTEDLTVDAARVHQAISDVSARRGLAKGRVVLFGFSQGAVVAAQIAAADPDHYAGAIIMSPGSLNQLPLQAQSGTGTVERFGDQSYVSSVGGGESAGNLLLAKQYVQSLKGLGARVVARVVVEQTDHAFPDDFFERFESWMMFVLASRGGLSRFEIPQDVVDDNLRAFIADLVEQSYTTDDDIVQLTTIHAESKGFASDPARVEELLKSANAAKRDAETRYRGLTSNDRLNLAFAHFEASNILARQNTSISIVDGVIYGFDHGSREQLPENSESRGVVYFELARSPSAEDGARLQFRFHSRIDDSDKLRPEIQGVLDAAGIRTQWTRNAPHSLFTEDFTWQRRRFTKPNARAVKRLERKLRRVKKFRQGGRPARARDRATSEVIPEP